MAESNSNEPVVDDDKEVTEEDLRDLKYPKDGVEPSEEGDDPAEDSEAEVATEDTSAEDGQTDDQATDDEEQSDDASDFVKEFPNIKGDTPEEYAKNLEIAYQNSFVELKRIRDEAAKPDPAVGDVSDDDLDPYDPYKLYAKQKMDEEILAAYTDFSKHYPQVQDANEYAKFTQEVATLSQTILSSQKRLAPASELYKKAAVILGWESEAKVDDKERLGSALKDAGSTSKSATGTKKPSKSKVTDQMIAVNRLMYPGKSDAEIREELEPYV